MTPQFDAMTFLSQDFPGLGSNPLPVIIVVSALSLVPFCILSATSFLKLSVVFGILRNAIGAQQIPSSALLSLLALVLTLQIMSPVFFDSVSCISEQLEPVSGVEPGAQTSVLSAGFWASLGAQRAGRIVASGAEPFRRFLIAHSGSKERLFFAGLGQLQNREEHESGPGFSSQSRDLGPAYQSVQATTGVLPGETIFTLLTAFMISELHEAFAIGFLIYLPFLVIDLVVANLLVGLGMMMVSPVTISLPLKIVLFVLCDGWFLLCRGLVLGYVT